MTKKKVSVLMSTKDTKEKFLRAAIESILEQTYYNFEFLIVNDGGKEDLKIIESYNDSRIKVINHKESIGLTKSLNEMINIATGEYLARMDSDDVSAYNRFEKQVEYLEKNKNVDICSSYSKYIGKKHKKIIDIYTKPYEKHAELFFYNRIIHSSIMMRKSFIDKYSIKYNESFKYSQDYELWNRISSFANIQVIPKIYLFSRVHNMQISSRKIGEQNKLCERIIIDNLKKLDIKEKKYIDYVMFLSSKKTLDLCNDEIETMNKTLFLKNGEKKEYEEKTFKTILYYRLMIISIKQLKIINVIKYAFLCNFLKIMITTIKYYFKSLSIFSKI